MQFSTLFLAITAALFAPAADAQAFLYKFDPANSVGINGGVVVQYESKASSKAKVFAAIDFSKVDLKAIAKFDGNCSVNTPITEYKWHIHVKWSSKRKGESLGQCGKAFTGDHYDPLKACGPFSEFAATPECIPKVPKYACDPAKYAKNFQVCEKGDLSGKLGSFKPNKRGLVKTQWVDPRYPFFSENTPQWNIIIHAVCGKVTPRITCALGQQIKLNGQEGSGWTMKQITGVDGN